MTTGILKAFKSMFKHKNEEIPLSDAEIPKWVQQKLKTEYISSAIDRGEIVIIRGKHYNYSVGLCYVNDMPQLACTKIKRI